MNLMDRSRDFKGRHSGIMDLDDSAIIATLIAQIRFIDMIASVHLFATILFTFLTIQLVLELLAIVFYLVNIDWSL